MAEWLRQALAAARRWSKGERAEIELQDDVESFAQLLADEKHLAGASVEDARRLALAEMGGAETLKESVRQARAGAAIDATLQDTRYAFRALRRTPGFVIAAVATLSLGVGVSTAVFGAVDATLLKPLPYRSPAELMDLGHHVNPGTRDERTFIGLDSPEVDFWRSARDLFQGVEAYDGRTVAFPDNESGGQLQTARMTAGLPALLGVGMSAGRMFSADEALSAAPVAVISDGFWKRRFDRSRQVLGSELLIDKQRVTIVGVLSPKFRYGPGLSGLPDVWRPVALTSGLLSTVFRLRTGISQAAAQTIAEVAARRWQASHPAREPWTPELIAVDSRRSVAATAYGNPLRVLLGMATVLLFVAAANLSNLLQVRMLSRRRELALRAALGASRTRLIRLLVAEGFLLITAGTLAAVGVAWACTQLLVGLVPPRMSFAMFAVTLPTFDARLFGFMATALAVVIVLSVLVPAFRLPSRKTPNDALRAGGWTSTPPQVRRSAAVLQAFQMALALLLATVALLVASSFVRVSRAELGFDPDRLYSVSIALPRARYPDYATSQAWFAELLARTRQMPGVDSAAFGTPPPNRNSIRLGTPERPDRTPFGTLRSATDGYFKTSGIRLIAGREFEPGDGRMGSGGANHVAIVEQATADALWPGESPVGKLIQYGPVKNVRVIGEVANVAAYDFKSGKPANAVYTPLAQEFTQFATLIVRGASGHDSPLRMIQDAIRQAEPASTITNAGLVTNYYAMMETYSGPRFYAALVVIFAVLALAVSAVGLYGLLAFGVEQRQREIGVRIALGSTNRRVRRLVLVDVLRPAVVGLAIGWGAAWVLTKYLGTLLYGVSPRDPLVFVAAGATLIVVSLIAAVVPMRKATRVDPMVVLKAE
jgi:putative ABC transport system permease protein